VNPSLKPVVHRALAAQLRWKVLPLRSVVQHPEDAVKNQALVDLRAASQRIARRIWYPSYKKIDHFFAKSWHANSTNMELNRSWDRLFMSHEVE
jgi:hypothetical protein